MNTLISLLVLVLVLGLIFYVVRLIPLPPPFQTVTLVILAIIAILYLVSMLGALPGVHLPRLN